ncbi:MAG: alpha/beta fold hydrolase, partial [Actinomycetota bacterium]|nr:alpha/beta fold hydrolase [Actinomycetota bacterium]
MSPIRNPRRGRGPAGLSVSARLLTLAVAVILVGSAGTAVGHPVGAGRGQEVTTVDHVVPHVSTVPANAGEEVRLFVRERLRREFSRGQGPRRWRVVLFLPGCCTPSVPAYDLPFQDYSWMGHLAQAGFDVFALDLTGFGLSPRPKMDDPCNVNPEQQALLVPNPLPAPCDPSYPFQLGNIEADLDEIDTVVKYLQDLRGVDRVSFVGWSAAAPRIGAYAARHPEKVDKLFFYAPVYDPKASSRPPDVLPTPGFPTRLRTRSQQTSWEGIRCQDQRNPAIADPLWDTTLDFDPLGRSWGPPEGVMRIRTTTQFWGWNAEIARRVESPALTIVGEFDQVAIARELHEDLGTQDKIFV